ncbi:Non-specific serine/threonine protein kinase [Bertholletia excelsa]
MAKASEKNCVALLLFLPFFLHCFLFANSYVTDFPSVKPPASWTNNLSDIQGSVVFADNVSSLRPILLLYNKQKNNPPLCFGFLSNETSPKSFYLALVLVQELRPIDKSNPSKAYAIDEFSSPIILWSANRDIPVGEDATLEFSKGGLVLKSELGRRVWATNTRGQDVAQLRITVEGNLVLLNSSNGIVWQSFDYPIDSWLPNQKIYFPKGLTSRNSSSNLSEGMYSMHMARHGSRVNFSLLDSGRHKNEVARVPLHRVEFEGTDSSIDLFQDYAQFKCNLATDGIWLIVLEPDGNLYLYQSQRINQFDFPMMRKSDVWKVIWDSQKSKKRGYLVPILLSSAGGVLVTIALIAVILYKYRMSRKEVEVEEEGEDDQVTENLTRFSLDELKTCTKDFSVKLGRGGFGSVYEGTLCDGRKVAVKCLEAIGPGHGRKEFLAEVNTIGKVDHFNLVKLIGYCSERSNRLLVYEYMTNGSLDKWIFNSEKAKVLTWRMRQKIIHGVAKGLEYLHEECSRNIIHFDIKPQNILLDRDFNPKISDFGLARLIDQSQSTVLTALKGTPGYLAPELLGCINISVKADVYSFGIVILEIVCGRKNLNLSEPIPLIDIVKKKIVEERLDDVIDECSEEVKCHREEAIEMLKVALWCLQAHERRPPMSMVVKVLEGSAEPNLVADPEILTMGDIDVQIQFNSFVSIPLGISMTLSGPR